VDNTRWETWVSVCWPDRREEVGQCADRALRMMGALGKVDDCFKAWSTFSRRKLIPFEPSVPALEKLMLEGRNWNDEIPPRVIEDLGYSTGFHAGGTDLSRAIQFSLSCGEYAGVSLNGVNVEIRNGCAAASRIINASKLSEILAMLAESWEPDWGSVRQRDLRDHGWIRPDYDGFSPTAGWLTYLSAQRGEIPPLPAKFQATPVKSLGSIIVATEEDFDPESEGHVQAIDELNRLLANAGLLSPAQQA